MPMSDGSDLWVEVWREAKDGSTPVVLLHGLSQQRLFWGPVVHRMRASSVASIDQRGHGLSNTPLTADYSIDRCAKDALEVCHQLGWGEVVLVGHSWGAAVALHAAALAPKTVTSVGLIDGGLWGPIDLMATGESKDLDAIRQRLRPPELGISHEELWTMVRNGAMSPWWSDEVRAALEGTFSLGEDGLIRTTIGVDRHMKVLDGLLAYAPEDDLVGFTSTLWVALCEADSTSERSLAVQRAKAVPGVYLQRWLGAVHDVPLQWPSMVAGLIDTMVEIDVGRGRGLTN